MWGLYLSYHYKTHSRYYEKMQCQAGKSHLALHMSTMYSVHAIMQLKNFTINLSQFLTKSSSPHILDIIMIQYLGRLGWTGKYLALDQDVWTLLCSVHHMYSDLGPSIFPSRPLDPSVIKCILLWSKDKPSGS